MKYSLSYALLRYLQENEGWHKKGHLYSVSDQLGYSKPHENVYHTLIAQSGVASTEIVHVGDSVLCDINVPEMHGINTSQVHSNGKSLTSVIDEIK